MIFYRISGLGVCVWMSSSFLQHTTGSTIVTGCSNKKTKIQHITSEVGLGTCNNVFSGLPYLFLLIDTIYTLIHAMFSLHSVVSCLL